MRSSLWVELLVSNDVLGCFGTGLIAAFGSNAKRGLSKELVAQSQQKVVSFVCFAAISSLRHARAQFGSNRLPTRRRRQFYEMMMDALEDKVLIVLICASILSIVSRCLSRSPFVNAELSFRFLASRLPTTQRRAGSRALRSCWPCSSSRS